MLLPDTVRKSERHQRPYFNLEGVKFYQPVVSFHPSGQKKRKEINSSTIGVFGFRIALPRATPLQHDSLDPLHGSSGGLWSVSLAVSPSAGSALNWKDEHVSQVSRL